MNDATSGQRRVNGGFSGSAKSTGRVRRILRFRCAQFPVSGGCRTAWRSAGRLGDTVEDFARSRKRSNVRGGARKKSPPIFGRFDCHGRGGFSDRGCHYGRHTGAQMGCAVMIAAAKRHWRLYLGVFLVSGGLAAYGVATIPDDPAPVAVVPASVRLPPHPARPGPSDVWRQAYSPVPIADKVAPLCQECRLNGRN